MDRVLLLCGADPRSDPRPNRMINWLKERYEVTVACSAPDTVALPGATVLTAHWNSHQEPVSTSVKERVADRLLRKVSRLLFKAYRGARLGLWWSQLLLGRHDYLSRWQIRHFDSVKQELRNHKYALIISEDMVLMPLAFDVNAGAPVWLDAREYYTRNYDDQMLWRHTHKPVLEYLCRAYLPRCNKVFTVSKGLAQEYEREFGVKADVLMSLPVYHELPPVEPHPDRVRLIHHGHASRSRRIETMIEMMDYLDDRYILDLMLIPGPTGYWEYLTQLAAARKNVRILPPVSMGEIVPSTNAYDVGVFLCPPSNFNLKHTLPNKLFEFIQARLAVAIGPSVEMQRIVNEHQCGVVAADFEPQTLAQELRRLTAEDIWQYKLNSDRAARVLNADVNQKRILALVRETIGH